MAALLLDPFAAPFMARALTELLLLAVLALVVSTHVLTRRLGFVADTMTHTVFPGVVLGFLAAGVDGVFPGALAAAAVTAVLLTLAAGATLLAIGLIAGVGIVETIAAYFLLASAVLAWYTGSAMVLEAAHKRVVLPMGKRAEPNVPGREAKRTIQFELGEPGIKVGQ